MAERNVGNSSDAGRLIASWLEITGGREVSIGLDSEDAISRAEHLREQLRSGGLPGDFALDVVLAETLHALNYIFRLEEPSETLLCDIERTFEFITALEWSPDELGGNSELLCQLSFLGWRVSSWCNRADNSAAWRKRFRVFAEETGLRAWIEQLIESPLAERLRLAEQVELTSEQLLTVADVLWNRAETNPVAVRSDAEFFFHLSLRPVRSGQAESADYHIGEMALLAGATARFLGLRDESRRWLDQAETHFRLVHSPSADLLRVTYQRLAVSAEDRNFAFVLSETPHLVEAFAKLNLHDEALKCRFLEAVTLKELFRMEEAKALLEIIRREAAILGNDRLAAIASENIFQIHAFLGETEQALIEAETAIPMLKRLENRVGLVKLQLSLGYLLRASGRIQDSIEAFRAAKRELAEIGMRADLAATQLVIADLLLDANEPVQAEWEIAAALPVIQELNLVPEGIAALALLRESLRRRQIDRQALRSLNGYFEELKS
jgi:tetratricopeptide (TPR) repeat protein